MQKWNGRQRQNSYRWKPRVRDPPISQKNKEERRNDGGEEEGGGDPYPPPHGPDVGEERVEQEQREEGSASGGGGIDGNWRGRENESTKDTKAKTEVEEKPKVGVEDEYDGAPVPGPSSRKTEHREQERKSNQEVEAKDSYCKDSEGEWKLHKSKKTVRGSRANFEEGRNQAVARTNSRCSTHDMCKTTEKEPVLKLEQGQKTDADSVDQRNKQQQKCEQPNSTGAKKKLKPKLNKEQRQKKRDDAALKDLYKPKDSRITVLDPQLFQRIKAEASGSPATPSISAVTFRFPTADIITPSQASISDFPTLDSATATKVTPGYKSFAGALVSAIPSVPRVETEETPKSSNDVTTPLHQCGTSTSTSISNYPASATPKKPKLSKRPITVNLEDLLQQTPKKNLVANKQISRKLKHDRLSTIRENPKLTIGNLLDSTGPVVVHRGKIKQKKKKPTKLKKIIMLSRNLRKSGESDSSFAQTINSMIDNGHGAHIKHENNESSQGKEEEENQEFADTATAKVPEENENDDSCAKEDSLEDGEAAKLEHGTGDSVRALMETAEENAKPKPSTPENVVKLVKLQMHTRKFRDYCDMFVDKELHGLVISLMQELHRLQDRIYKSDPIKLQTKRRYVNGIKEALNALKLRRSQLVILAPDIEPNKVEGGLDQKVMEIISLCKEHNVPCIFSGNRFILGKCIKQNKSPVSVIAVLDKQSVEEQFNRVLEYAESLRERYQQEFDRRVQEIMANGEGPLGYAFYDSKPKASRDLLVQFSNKMENEESDANQTTHEEGDGGGGQEEDGTPFRRVRFLVEQLMRQSSTPAFLERILNSSTNSPQSSRSNPSISHNESNEATTLSSIDPPQSPLSASAFESTEADDLNNRPTPQEYGARARLRLINRMRFARFPRFIPTDSSDSEEDPTETGTTAVTRPQWYIPGDRTSSPIEGRTMQDNDPGTFHVSYEPWSRRAPGPTAQRRQMLFNFIRSQPIGPVHSSNTRSSTFAHSVFPHHKPEQITLGGKSFKPVANLDKLSDALPAKPKTKPLARCHEKAMAARFVQNFVTREEGSLRDGGIQRLDIFNRFWTETSNRNINVGSGDQAEIHEPPQEFMRWEGETSLVNSDTELWRALSQTAPNRHRTFSSTATVGVGTEDGRITVSVGTEDTRSRTLSDEAFFSSGEEDGAFPGGVDNVDVDADSGATDYLDGSVTEEAISGMFRLDVPLPPSNFRGSPNDIPASLLSPFSQTQNQNDSESSDLDQDELSDDQEGGESETDGSNTMNSSLFASTPRSERDHHHRVLIISNNDNDNEEDNYEGSNSSNENNHINGATNNG